MDEYDIPEYVKIYDQIIRKMSPSDIESYKRDYGEEVKNRERAFMQNAKPGDRYNPYEGRGPEWNRDRDFQRYMRSRLHKDYGEGAAASGGVVGGMEQKEALSGIARLQGRAVPAEKDPLVTGLSGIEAMKAKYPEEYPMLKELIQRRIAVRGIEAQHPEQAESYESLKDGRLNKVREAIQKYEGKKR